MSISDHKIVIVGSGFFGAVMAERIATQLGQPVLVVERRSHLGGNSFSETDAATGIEFHRYGTHLFHTSNDEVWSWINRFTAFNNYRHRVLSRHAGRMYTMPINLMTLNNFFGTDLDPSAAVKFLEARAGADFIDDPQNLEEKAISLIGRDLYQAFIRGYTAKQWETDPKLLPADIIKRLPVRYNYNDFYFNDTHEGLPIDGYHAIFTRIFSHAGIETLCNCDFFDIRDQIDPEALIIYTGPLDRYFEYRCGKLGWRTLDFEIERPETEDFQGASVVNYPDEDVRYTRIHEFRHLHPERRYGKERTMIMREYSRFATVRDEPYYPIDTPSDKAIYDQYAGLVKREKNIVFGGRLGTYRYLDMHQAIGAALKSFSNEVAPFLTSQRANASAGGQQAA